MLKVLKLYLFNIYEMKTFGPNVIFFQHQTIVKICQQNKFIWSEPVWLFHTDVRFLVKLYVNTKPNILFFRNSFVTLIIAQAKNISNILNFIIPIDGKNKNTLMIKKY